MREAEGIVKEPCSQGGVASGKEWFGVWGKMGDTKEGKREGRKEKGFSRREVEDRKGEGKMRQGDRRWGVTSSQG